MGPHGAGMGLAWGQYGVWGRSAWGCWHGVSMEPGAAWGRMGLVWGRMGPHGVGMGLAWGWHGASIGLAWMGLAWGWHWHGASMGPVRKTTREQR
jgi:hypothetical protein